VSFWATVWLGLVITFAMWVLLVVGELSWALVMWPVQLAVVATGVRREMRDAREWIHG
jgi:hypothetical protein